MANFIPNVTAHNKISVNLRDIQIREDEWEFDELGGRRVPRRTINAWTILPTISIIDPIAKRMAFRLNSFANLFYFGVQVLGKKKFQLTADKRKNLHWQMCMVVMKDGLKEVIEIPRDHFKSTVFSECFPIWRALPFTKEDEDYMYDLGCSPLYIHWMKRAHNQDIRIILVSEVTRNAEKLGKRTRNHYENNKLFKHLFPEILPKSGNTWTNTSLHQTRTETNSGDGEGTFDFIGVGGALQSTHYDLAVQDDLVGKDALKSEVIMNDTIEYHQLLAGAINADNTDAKRDFDEIVVGNRWSYKDLNSWIRAKEDYFNFTTHSALGGCCSLHEIGTPIFPESFSLEKLARYKKRFGTYFFSCQWLNYPINPEKQKFELGNLRYFNYTVDGNALGIPKIDHSDKYSLQPVKPKMRVIIRHHVAEGDVEDDIFPRNLQRVMIIDPNHKGANPSQKKARCRHALIVAGASQAKRRIYCLRAWAKACALDEFVNEIFRTAIAFKITTIHIETVGAQTYLKWHLEYFIQVNKNKPEWAGLEYINFADLKSSSTDNAKFERIDSFVPVTERKQLWLNADDCEQVKEEMEAYGNHGALIDILDCFGYLSQVIKFDDHDEEELQVLLNVRQSRFLRAMATASN